MTGLSVFIVISRYKFTANYTCRRKFIFVAGFLLFDFFAMQVFFTQNPKEISLYVRSHTLVVTGIKEKLKEFKV